MSESNLKTSHPLILLFSIILALAGLAIIALRPTPSQPPPSSPTAGPTTSPPSQSPTPTQTPTTTPSPELVWREVTSFEGYNGEMNTELFQIVGDEWRVHWEIEGKCGMMAIHVYDENGSYLWGNRTFNPVSHGGIDVPKGKGTHRLIYLKVTASCPSAYWKLTIEEKAPSGIEPISSAMPQKYSVVENWSGVEPTFTEVFNITRGPWRISWESPVEAPYSLTIKIFDAQGNQIDVVGTRGPGYSYIYTEGGTFYLGISEIGLGLRWEVTVEEPG